MSMELVDVHLLDEHSELSLVELAEYSGLSREVLLELVDCGAILPKNPDEATIHFAARWVVTARTACRLREDFELDTEGVALALSLLARIRELEAQIGDLSAQLPRRVR